MVHAERDHAWVHGFLLPELGLPEGAVVTPADFTPGTSRVAEVERAIEGARVVVLVLTPAFLGDTWAELGELLASHARVLAGDGRLVPLLLEPCELPLRHERAPRYHPDHRARRVPGTRRATTMPGVRWAQTRASGEPPGDHASALNRPDR